MTNPYQLALAEVGVKEIRGGLHNPTVLQYYKDAGHGWVDDDETPWCAAFASAMIARAGYPNPGTLRARDFEAYGEHVWRRGEDLGKIRKGDILVFERGSNPAFGHVGFSTGVIGAAAETIEVLGGNQNNAVNVKDYPLRKLVAVRRGPWVKKRRSLVDILLAIFRGGK